MTPEKIRRIRRFLTYVLTFCAVGFITYRAGCQNVPPADPPADARIVDITIDNWVVKAEVANTERLRREGLSGRRELTPDRGMLFVFNQPKKAEFWMKDTTIPLSVAFIRSDGTVVDVQQMSPQSSRSHVAPEPVKYALEVRQGWFEVRELQPPFKVDLPEDFSPAENDNDSSSNPDAR